MAFWEQTGKNTYRRGDWTLRKTWYADGPSLFDWELDNVRHGTHRAFTRKRDATETVTAIEAAVTPGGPEERILFALINVGADGTFKVPLADAITMATAAAAGEVTR